MGIGLTASLGIGKYVGRLVQEALAEHGRGEMGGETGGAASSVRTTPLPSIDELVESFRQRGDGTVVFGSDEMSFGPHLVTHPLSLAGLTRLASS